MGSLAVLGQEIYPTLMRPPFGSIDNRVYKLMIDMEYTPVMWNLDPKDYTDYGNQHAAILNFVSGFVRNNTGMPSFIHLGHDLKPESIAITKELITLFKNTGVKIVTLDDCLGIPGGHYVSKKNVSYSFLSEKIVLSDTDTQYFSEVAAIPSASVRLTPSLFSLTSILLIALLSA